MNLADNRKQWIKRVSDYRNSGINAKAWCEKHGIKYSALHYWITKLNRENTSTSISAEVKSNTNFVSIIPASIPPHTDTSLVLTMDAFTLTIPKGFNQQHLLNVLKVLKQC